MKKTMELKAKISTMLCLLIMIASLFVVLPIVRSSPETYGPRLDEIYGYIIESPAAQRFELETGGADIWFDIREPEVIRELEDADFEMTLVPEAFTYYHIDFNVRDQIGNGTHIPCELGTYAERWRDSIGDNDALYYTYSGAQYENYVPLDDQPFRHAIAHLVPKAVIEAVAYGGVAGSAIDSTVPPALSAWHKPYVNGHPYLVSEAISILQGAGYVWTPGAPQPVAGAGENYWGVEGNWLDPATALAADDGETFWDDTLGSPMNHITFAGVTTTIAPRSWLRDDLCCREWNNIGLPILHEEVAFSTLTDVMMDYYQYDMYALGWIIGRNPDSMYAFFHANNNFCPEGYNIPGVNNATLNAELERLQFNINMTDVKIAAYNVQDMLAQLCVSIPTVTRPGIAASAKAGAPGHTDTLRGVINSPGYTQENDWTYYQMRWLSAETTGNPYGIGGDVYYLIGSPPTNYHPGYASTADEWMVVARLFDGLLNVDPFTARDLPWIAKSWTIEDWDDPGLNVVDGMNITFYLRDDVYWHDGVQFDASSVEFSLEFPRDQRIGRYQTMWENLYDVEVQNSTAVSAYQNATSLWVFYDTAGSAALFARHIFDPAVSGIPGSDLDTFRPEQTVNPTNSELTCMIGTGPFIYRDLGMPLTGQAAHLVAYRPAADPTMGITTHWFMSVEDIDALMAEMFHWVGDVGGASIPGTDPTEYYPPDGEVQIYDLTRGGISYGLWYFQEGYDVDVDIAPETIYHTPDGIVEGRDIAELAKHWGDCRDYHWPP